MASMPSATDRAPSDRPAASNRSRNRAFASQSFIVRDPVPSAFFLFQAERIQESRRLLFALAAPRDDDDLAEPGADQEDLRAYHEPAPAILQPRASEAVPGEPLFADER